jgi:hypothetical protein
VKQRSLAVVGLVITVVCLYWAFRGIHYRQVLDTIGNVDYRWAPLIFGSTLLSIWLRAYRWQVMLTPIRRVTLASAYSATMIGFMANNVLPMRLGEVVRAYSLGRNSRVSRSSAFATIVVERAFDLVALLLFLAVLLLQYSFAPWLETLGYFALGVCILMFGVMALARWKRHVAVKVFRFFLRPLPHALGERLDDLFHKFLDGFEVLARGHHILWVSVLSLAIWFAVAGSFYFTLVTFRLDLPPTASFVLMVVCALGVMLPSGPGFVGTFEVAAKYGLLLFNVSEDVAVSYALFYHAVQFVPVTLLGFYHLWRENFSLSRAVEGDGDPSESPLEAESERQTP